MTFLGRGVIEYDLKARDFSLRARLGLFAGLLAISSFSAIAPAAAQAHATGLIRSDPEAVEQFPVAQLRRGFVTLDRVDLSAAMPPPRDQGEFETCAAWAAVYGAASYYARWQLHDPDIALSPSYVYNQVPHPNDRCAGTALIQILLFLQKRGAVKLDDYPATLFCEADKSATEVAPIVFRIPYAHVVAFAPYDDDGKRKIVTPLDIDLIRQILANGDPVVIGLRTTDMVLDHLGPGQIYSEQAASDPSRRHDNHALVLVGYDNRKQAFRLMNSWGGDWSDHGYGWISYSSARSEIQEAFYIEGSHPPLPTSQPNEPDRPSFDGGACSSFKITSAPSGYRLSGFVENSGDRDKVVAGLPALERKLGRRIALGEVDIRPWPQCEALLALDVPLASADRPRLRTLDGRTSFLVGDRFGFELVAPDYPSFLYLIYLQADGEAVNLLARDGLVRRQVAPGAVLRIGDPAAPGPKFRASEPTGPEVVIAIAARSPIAQLEDLEQAGGRYFRTGFDGKAGGAEDPQDRRVLSALNDALQSRPVVAGKTREIGADLLFLSIGR